ncbi:MAG: hypothetical protein HFJ28_07190 [Clostridia bacterium]|jgi:cbb3-type cytochrome oxidase subunit 3|nr:hypothetical protein [Clostridia bacterium]
MLKKLMDYLYSSRKNALRFSVLAACSCFFFPILISLLLIKLPWFSKFSIYDLSCAFIVIFIGLFLCLSAYMLWTAYKEEREEEQNAKNLTQADYENAYQDYVDIVKNILQKEEYQEITLKKDWILKFADYFLDISELRKNCFTDFEIAACLMFAVTPIFYGTIHIRFAFECAKELIGNPSSYEIIHLDSYRLQIAEKESSSIIDFSIPDPKLSSEATLSLLGTYLSLRSNIYSILPLADFLRILYIRQQKLQS